MSRRMHALFLPLVFPAGIAPGEGGDYNRLVLARNGANQPVLRGTALAGALRHAYDREQVRALGIVLPRDALRESGDSAAIAQKATNPEDELQQKRRAKVNKYFGTPLGKNDDEPGKDSSLKVSDCVLQIGDNLTRVRTHHLRNRHTGTVADGGLFTIESCPPGSTTTAALLLEDQDPDPENAPQFLRILVGFLDQGITLGGHAARGIGLAQLAGEIVYRRYNREDIDDHADWLDEYRAWRDDATCLPTKRHELQPASSSDPEPNELRITVHLSIPRGQDLLVGDGQGLDHEIEPQRVIDANGRQYWRLPGASLRGLFRGWMTRLAAREGKTVADQALRQRELLQGNGHAERDAFNGRNLGWCFISEADRKSGVLPTCPVADLFGSLFWTGRLHISDALARCSSDDANAELAEEQPRMHVAVDRITGGAAESMLFENTVLTTFPSGESPVFEVTMRVQDPTDDDARWLAETLRALHLGILRVGSSKSSGRLALTGEPDVVGPEHMTQCFNGLVN